MRILFVTQQMDIGGVETHLVYLTKQLSAHGHKVDIVSAGGQLEAQLNPEETRHFTLPLNQKSPFAFFRNYYGLKKIIASGNYDVVHSHARIPSFVLSRLSKHLDFRWVTTCHGVYRDNFFSRKLNLWGDACLAVSDDVKEYLKTVYHFPSDRIYPTINGIDTDQYIPLVKSSAGHNIVCVSRLTPYTISPILELFKAVKSLSTAYQDVSLSVIGGGESLSLLRAEAAKINRLLHREAITLSGPKSHVAAFLQTADVFVGGSRAAFEAMSCALPVILAGAQGYSGILSESNRSLEMRSNYCCRGKEAASAELFVRDLSALFSNTVLADQLGKENRLFVQRNLSVQLMAEYYEDFYASLPLRRNFPHPDLVVSGYFGFHNAGDDETIRSFLNELYRVSPDKKVLVLASKSKESSAFYQVKCLNRYRLFRIFLVLRKAKLFVACGGSLLQDATSMRSLLYYTSLFYIASIARCQKAIYAAGIGPLHRKISQKLVVSILRGLVHLSLRDEGSANLIREITDDSISFDVTTDTVFLTAPVSPEPTKEFGISLRKSKLDFQNDKEFDSFLKKFGEAIDLLRIRTGLTPVLLIMHPTHDTEITERFASTYHVPVAKGSEVLEKAHSCSFVISMRLHSLLFAVTEGHCAFGLSSDPKVQNLLLPFSLPTVLPKNFIADAFVSLVLYSLEEKKFSAQRISQEATHQRLLAQRDFQKLLSFLDPHSL